MTTHLNNLVRAFLSLAFFLTLGASLAQSPASPSLDHPLSLKECVRIAAEHNPNVQAMLHAGRAAMAKIGTNRAAYWPTLNFTGLLQRSYSESQGGSSRQAFLFPSSTSTSTDASLAAQYTVWNSGQRKAAVEGAEATYQASDATYHATTQDLALSVETAYYTLEGTQWGLQVAQETLKQNDFHLEMAEAQHRVGLVALSDVLQAATAEANAKLGVIQAQGLVTSSRTSLAVLMGLPSDTPLEIQPMDRDAPLPDLPDWRSGRDRALSSLPEIQAAFQNSESLRFAIRQTEASYLPSITANGTAGFFDAGSWPNRNEWSAGLTLRIPVFTGFARKYQVLQAKEAWKGSEMALQNTKLTSEKAAYDARIQLATALQAVEAAQSLVKSAQENSDVADGQYKNGLGTMTNVVDAAASLSSAKYQLISARFAVLTALATWNRTTGLDLLEGVPLPSTSPQHSDGDAKP